MFGHPKNKPDDGSVDLVIPESFDLSHALCAEKLVP
jgi:hypothetical protein